MAITFPLVFGWIHFRTRPDDQMTYVTYLFGFPAGLVPPPHGRSSWLLFHGLDVAAVLVLAGIALALWRRMRDRGRAGACRTSACDFFPLILLFAISVTGLALTVSQRGCAGGFYGFLAILHAITVIAALLYLPFGKFFHIFQRPAQLGVKLYQRARRRRTRARSARAAASASPRACTIDDLRAVLPQLGFDYRDRRAGRQLAGAVPGLQAQDARAAPSCGSKEDGPWLSRR